MQTTSGINTTGPGAKSDQLTASFQWADLTNAVQQGQPVYVNLCDAGPLNAGPYSTTTVATSANTGGTVLCGTNVSAGQILGSYVGTATVAASAVIQVARFGLYPVLAAAKASGTAVTVGSYLIADTTQTACLASATIVAGKTLGQVVATGNAVQSGASIIAVPGSGTTTKLVNCMINPC